MRPYFYRHRWMEFVITAGIVAGIVLLHFVGILRPVEDLAVSAVQPFSRAVVMSKIRVKNLFSNVFTDKQARIEELESGVALLKSKLAQLKTVEEENITLRRQLGVQARRSSQQILAHVIGDRIASSASYNLLIDVGTLDGVTVGDPIISNGALVGYIISADRTVSDAMLITDPNSTVSAYVASADAGGLVKGDIGFARITMTQIDRNAQVHIGDSVLTTGTDGPSSDILIGEISEILTADHDTYQTVAIIPAADLRNLAVFFVLID